MDFLKSIFGDKTLTYAELETALKDSKDIKQILPVGSMWTN